MKKKILAITLTLAMMTTMLVGCGGGNQAEAPAPQDGEEQPVEQTEPAVELTATQKIIAEAEGMTLEELAKKAIEESNGKMFYGVGNSSRGKSALPLFIEYLQ